MAKSIEAAERAARDGSERNDGIGFRPEVVTPAILARIEESHSLTRLRIDRSDIGALVAIAEDACIRQVIRRRRSSVLAADHVIDLVSKAPVIFVDAAVFATIVSPPSHFGAECCGNVTCHARESAWLWPLPF